jgi:hypothetical protein
LLVKPLGRSLVGSLRGARHVAGGLVRLKGELGPTSLRIRNMQSPPSARPPRV